MSSYLTFYLVPKVKDNEPERKPISLISYSRSSDVYQYFNDTLNVAYIGMGDEPQYSELTVSMVDEVLDDLRADISKIENRVTEYEKHAAGNTEIIDEIISQKEYADDLKWALNKIEFIRDIVMESTHSWNDYNKVLCNVD